MDEPTTRRRWTALRALAVAAVSCAVVALLLIGVTRATAPDAAAPSQLVGRTAPTFALPTAQGGGMLPTSTHFDGRSGRPTLIVFFNTLCVHCLGVTQAAQEAVAAQPSGATLDIVYVDSPGENAQITGAYFARLRLDPPVLLDTNSSVAARYGVNYYPTLALVDSQGVIRATWTGDISSSALAAQISRALRG